MVDEHDVDNSRSKFKINRCGSVAGDLSKPIILQVRTRLHVAQAHQVHPDLQETEDQQTYQECQEDEGPSSLEGPPRPPGPPNNNGEGQNRQEPFFKGEICGSESPPLTERVPPSRSGWKEATGYIPTGIVIPVLPTH